MTLLLMRIGQPLGFTLLCFRRGGGGGLCDGDSQGITGVDDRACFGTCSEPATWSTCLLALLLNLLDPAGESAVALSPGGFDDRQIGPWSVIG